MPERILPNGHHQMRHQVKHHISGLRVHAEEKQRQLHQRVDKNQIDMSLFLLILIAWNKT
jgi:hypothetical protein